MTLPGVGGKREDLEAALAPCSTASGSCSDDQSRATTPNAKRLATFSDVIGEVLAHPSKVRKSSCQVSILHNEFIREASSHWKICSRFIPYF